MSGSVQTRVRALLRESDGLTIAELVRLTGANKEGVRSAIKAMPDTYIDRWAPAHNNLWAAVYCVVVPPEDCPKPEGIYDELL